MAMNHSQKKRLENVWEALKHDKIAIFSIIFLALILTGSGTPAGTE